MVDRSHDSFSKPQGLQPAKSGGDWDEPNPGAELSQLQAENAENAPDAMADIESQAWAHDPDANPDDVETQAAEEKIQEERQPDAEEATTQDDPEPAAEVQGASQRAQERIRELAAERKAAELRAEKLEKALAELLETQKRTTSLQEKVFKDQETRDEAARSQDREAALLARFEQLGLRKDSRADWLAFEAMLKAEAAEQRTKAIEDAERTRGREQAYRAYEDALRARVVAEAKRFKLADELHEDLFDQAYALARAKGIKDPAEAVARVMKPFAASAKPAAAVTKRPSTTDPVHQAISTRGRAAERKPGETTSGRPQKKSVEDIEREWGVGRRW